MCFYCKEKTAYELRISDCSSDVCSSDLEDPVWFGRSQDGNGARRTVWMAADRIESYADHYVQSTERHPMEVLAGIIERRGWSKRRIGVEMDNYYFSAKAFAVDRTSTRLTSSH